MNNKTFKSAKSALTLTVVRTNEDLVRIITQLPDETGRAIDLERYDTPAMMLALAEAAAVPMQGEFSGRRKGTAGHLSFIAKELELYVVESAHIEAEAKERAELEAEALELENAGRDAAGADRIAELSEMGHAGREFILAVARKAREIGRAER